MDRDQAKSALQLIKCRNGRLYHPVVTEKRTVIDDKFAESVPTTFALRRRDSCATSTRSDCGKEVAGELIAIVNLISMILVNCKGLAPGVKNDSPMTYFT